MNAMNAAFAAGATITELAPTTRISLRIADAGAAGLGLPTKIGERSAEGDRTALCLGPDEWLIEAPEAGRDALLAAVAEIKTPCSAVEVSDREITYRIEGPAAVEILAAGCPLDLAAIPVGGGTRTVFDSAQVVLTREADDRFHLTVWRSFVPHVRAILDLAARDFALGL